VATLTSLVLVSGCSLVKDPEATRRDRPNPSAGVTGPVAPKSPTTAPLAFDREDPRRFPEEDVRTVVAGRDVVLTMTDSTVIGRALPDLDTAYSLSAAGDEFTDLWADADSREGYSLEVTTSAGDGTEVGEEQYAVQRFDLDTGEIGDTVTVTLPQDPRSSSRDATARIRAVEGDRVVLDSWVPGADDAHTTVVVDLARGRLAWRARGSVALATTPRVVVLDTGTAEVAGRIEARDLRTGKLRWTALPGTLGASAIGTSDKAVIIARDDNVFPDATITRVRLRDGKEGKPRLATAWDWSCRRTPGPVAVCTLADSDQGDADRVVGWDVERNRRVWSLPTENRFAPIVTLVRGNLVYGVLDSGQGVVIDGVTGKDIAGSTGAAPVAANDWGGVALFDGTAIFYPATSPDEEPEEEGSFPSGRPTAPSTE
jgi:hypothetical protein